MAFYRYRQVVWDAAGIDIEGGASRRRFLVRLLRRSAPPHSALDVGHRRHLPGALEEAA